MAPKKTSKEQPKEDAKDQPKELSKVESKEHATKISKMLGLLKYRANPASNKKAIDMEDAQLALEQYASLDPTEKRSFVADFEKAGSGKKPGCLKFHLKYTKVISEVKEEEVATKEDYFTLPQILEFNGLKWHDFPEKKAKEIGIQLVKDNASSFGHNIDHIKHASMELLDKYFYVQGGSVAKRRRKERREEIAKDYDDKTAAQGIADGNLAGFDKEVASSSSAVKTETPQLDALAVKIGLLRASLSSLQKTSNQMNNLVPKFMVAGKKDEAMRLKGEELKQKISVLNEWMGTASMQLAEAEEIDKDDDAATIHNSSQTIGGVLSSSDHHLGGSKEALKRFQSMLGK